MLMCVYCTHWVEQDGKKQLSSPYAPVKLLRATWILLIEDGVGEQATCLTGQHLLIHTNTSVLLY